MWKQSGKWEQLDKMKGLGRATGELLYVNITWGKPQLEKKLFRKWSNVVFFRKRQGGGDGQHEQYSTHRWATLRRVGWCWKWGMMLSSGRKGNNQPRTWCCPRRSGHCLAVVEFQLCLQVWVEDGKCHTCTRSRHTFSTWNSLCSSIFLLCKSTKPLAISTAPI